MVVTKPIDELKKTLREELVTCPYGASGLEYKILFAKVGYTPHSAEHIIDPVDGREKLVMFDPCTRKSAIIYDVKKREIEWEYVVPGTTVRDNPHQGGMLLEDVEGFGRAGDVYCTDRDNNIIVVDRKTKEIKFRKKPTSFTPQFLVSVLKVIGNNVIALDYNANIVAKLSIPDLAEVWRRTDIPHPLKTSIIVGAGRPHHNPSFGGEYLVTANYSDFEFTKQGGVFELRDADGSTAWSMPNPFPDGRGAWVGAPGSAFRLGRVEWYGGITVICGEGGGGILGVGYTGEPAWGINSSQLMRPDGSLQYYYNPYNLAEVTYVFPTLNGRIGFIAWTGVDSSIVGEIVKLPEKQTVSYVLAFNLTTTDSFVYLEPIVADGWDEVQIGIRNTGTNSLDWTVRGYMLPFLNFRDYPSRGRFTVIPPATVPGGGEDEVDLVHPFCFYEVGVKSTAAGASTTFEVYVTKRRG
ncbi:MAG: hypothetical protein QXI11_07250 [Thermoproteota archaeon]